MTLRGLVISSGIGAEEAFSNRPEIEFGVAQVGPHFDPDLSNYDVLIAPNGTDHVALYRIKDKIRAFLDRGGAVCCFCGWFTDWIPGNRWIHDNSHPTREHRHILGDDPHDLMHGVDLARLDHNRHGISGWWACGYIEPANGANVLIKDPWERALVIYDDVTTPGAIYATASGPIGDYTRYEAKGSPISVMYENLLTHLTHRAQVINNTLVTKV